MPDRQKLVYDWNLIGESEPLTDKRVLLDADTLALAQEIARSRLKIRPNCAARTTIQDIDPVLDIADKTGVTIDAATFLGSSMIRQYVENWTMDDLMRRTEEAVTY